MKKLTYSLPAFLCILVVIVSCSREQASILQKADIQAVRSWLHNNGGSYKNETIMVQATGKPVYGKLDWDASRQYLWQGNTYIDVPFVFEKGNRYLTVQQAPPTTFNLVVRKTRNNQFEGAIRTTTYTRGEAENLSKGRREAGLVVQSYQWLNGQDANIWVGQENERQARAGKRLQLSATEIAALRAEAKNGGSDSAAGTLSRTVLQQQVCDVMVYTSYRTVCWYPTASDEAAMNATCMSVPVSSSVGYCYDMPGGSGGFPPYLLTWTEGGGGGGGPLPEPPEKDPCAEAKAAAEKIKNTFKQQATTNARNAAGNIASLTKEKGFAIYEKVKVDPHNPANVITDHYYTGAIATDNSETGVVIPVSVGNLDGLVATWHNHPAAGYSAPSPPDIYEVIKGYNSNIGNFTKNSFKGNFIEAANGDIYALTVTDPELANQFFGTQSAYVENREWKEGTEIWKSFDKATRRFGENNSGFENAMAYVLNKHNTGVSLSKYDPSSGKFEPISKGDMPKTDRNGNIKRDKNGNPKTQIGNPC